MKKTKVRKHLRKKRFGRTKVRKHKRKVLVLGQKKLKPYEESFLEARHALEMSNPEDARDMKYAINIVSQPPKGYEDMAADTLMRIMPMNTIFEDRKRRSKMDEMFFNQMKKVTKEQKFKDLPARRKEDIFKDLGIRRF